MAYVHLLQCDPDHRNLMKGALCRIEQDLCLIQNADRKWKKGYAEYLRALIPLLQIEVAEAMQAEIDDREHRNFAALRRLLPKE